MALSDNARVKLAIAAGDISVGEELQTKMADKSAAQTFTGTQTFSTIVSTNSTLTNATITTLTGTTANVPTVNATNIDAGASGTAGSVDVFPTTASKGKFTVTATDNTGDTTTTLTNAAMGQASVISVRDPLAATAVIDPEQIAVVTLTSAQILSLHTTPITVIAAPGANKAIHILSVQARHAGGTAYANIAAGDNLELRYTDGSGGIAATIETTGFLDSTAALNAFGWISDLGFLATANAVVVAHLIGAIDTGNFDVLLRIRYKIVATNFS